MTPGIVFCAIIGAVLGYVTGLLFLLGRWHRTGGLASPDPRIPWVLCVLLALSFPVYWAKFVLGVL